MKNENHGGNIYHIEQIYNIPKEEIIDFSSNINPLGPPAELKEMIIKNINDIKQYPDSSYSESYKQLALYHAIDKKNIIMGNGAIELIYAITRLLNPKRALIIAPTFTEYGAALELCNTIIDYEKLCFKNNFNINLNSLKSSIDKQYDLVVLCNPNNPTGSLIANEDMKKIINYTKSSNSTLLIDESFIEFVDNYEESTALDYAKQNKHVIILRSLTKFYAIPGLRLGYAICFDENIIDKINKYCGPWSVNVFASMIVKLLPELSKYKYKTKQLIQSERKYLFSEISNLNWLQPYPSEVNFMLLKIKIKKSSLEIKETLIKDKILIRDASNFLYLDNKYIRIAVKDRINNNILLKALMQFE